ncbi:hypothetical protein UL82_06795 [Corynebacterium kutscheri]|uniref:Uncharacterized protein n=2 Tax=Corynebacterium kutscheri TaxID=35755 RepID=A0A0F6TE50_9CORY|nr:hypothetical protein UL82_06795 [Corynebacterium kutscheri]VEH09848.1 hypothetical membrane protein [Corynebacterium kutscheri]
MSYKCGGIAMKMKNIDPQTRGLDYLETKLANKRLYISPKAGGYASVVVFAVLSFLIMGAVWGFLRPSYSATVIEGSQIAVGNEENVEFIAFFLYVVMTALIAGCCGIGAFLKLEKLRGLGMLFWVTLWSFLGGQIFLDTGELVAGLVHTVGENLMIGEVVRYVPRLQLGIAAQAVAPFWAVLLYWCAYVSTPEGEPTISVSSKNPTGVASEAELMHEGISEKE